MEGETFMDVRTCKKCGKLFQYTGIGEVFCPVCKRKDEEDFEKVKKYINDNPGTLIEKVAEENFFKNIKPATAQT